MRTIGILNSLNHRKIREPTSGVFFLLFFQTPGFYFYLKQKQTRKNLVGRLSSSRLCVKIVNKQFVASRDTMSVCVLWLFYRGFTSEVMSILGSLRWQMNRCNWVSICDMISYEFAVDFVCTFDMNERVNLICCLPRNRKTGMLAKRFFFHLFFRQTIIHYIVAVNNLVYVKKNSALFKTLTTPTSTIKLKVSFILQIFYLRKFLYYYKNCAGTSTFQN